MSQNSATSSSNPASNPGIATRLIAAVVGSFLSFKLVGFFLPMLLPALAAATDTYAIGAAVAVALIGLVQPKWLLFPLAGAVVPPYRLGKYLSGKAYSGIFPGIINFLIGMPLGIGAGVWAATYVGWAKGLSLLLWGPASVIAFVVTFFILSPALYLYILKPTCDKLEKLWKATRKAAEKYAKPFFQGIVDLVRNLPGSNKLWTWVEDKEKGAQWVDGFMGFVTGVGILALTGTVAYAVFNFVSPWIALFAAGWLFTGLTWFAAGIVAVAMVGIFFQLLEKGDVPFAATAISAGIVGAAWPLTTALGFGLGVSLAIAAVQFVIGLAYIYPGVHGLLKTGLIKAILDGVKELVKKTYDEEDKGYRKFFAHVVTPIVALISGGLAFWALSFYGLPLLLVIPTALVCAAVSYLGTGEAFEDFPTTIGYGAVLSLGVGFAGWWFLAGSITPYIFWPALALTVAFTFTVVLTALYLGFRKVTFGISASAGENLSALHKKAYDGARSLTKWWEKAVINKTYEVEKPYRDAFTHTFVAAVLGLGIWQALPLLAGFLGLPFWAIVSVLVVAALLVYLILGRIALGIGPIAAGFAVGLASFAGITWTLYQAAPSYWWLAAIVAGSFTSVVFYVITPAVLLIVNTLLGWAIAPLGTHVLGKVFDVAWARFEVVWNAFVAIAKVFNKYVLSPFLRLLGSLFKAIADAWASMTGRK